jgi:Tfp pilus assembly protein PilX
MARRGAALAAALVCLLLVLIYAGGVARVMSLTLKTTRNIEWQSQSFWLAESAIGRAVAQSQANPDYVGESWRVTTTHNSVPRTGLAVIRVERIEGTAGEIRIYVDATWPENDINRVVRRKELNYALGRGAGL